jgi:SAM-dependent methyltransferase
MRVRQPKVDPALVARALRAEVVAELCGEEHHIERTRALLGGIKLRPGDRVLEVGCGSGEVIRELARIGPTRVSIVGVDSDPIAVSMAQRNTVDLEGVSLLRMDARALTFADATFDFACTSRVLLHVSNPALVLSEMARVLVPGGRLLAIEPVAAFASAVDDNLRRRVHGQRHPAIGRDLPKMLNDVGIATRRCEMHAFVNDTPCQTTALRNEFRSNRGLFALACRLGSCSTNDVEAYFSLRERAMALGTFFECVLHVGVLGEKVKR